MGAVLSHNMRLFFSFPQVRGIVEDGPIKQITGNQNDGPVGERAYHAVRMFHIPPSGKVGRRIELTSLRST